MSIVIPHCKVIRSGQEYQTSGIKKGSLEELEIPFFQEDLRELNQAYDEYCKETTQLTYMQLVCNVMNSMMDHIDAFTPFFDDTTRLGRTTPSKVKTTVGWCYVICTSREEAALCPDKFCIMLSTKEIISKAFFDENANGVCINPYGDHPCLIPREYLLLLIKEMQDPVKKENNA